MTDLQISLAAARVNANMTQQDAANAIGVNKGTIISWENGRTSPNAVMLYKLSKVYRIPIANIFLPTKLT